MLDALCLTRVKHNNMLNLLYLLCLTLFVPDVFRVKH